MASRDPLRCDGDDQLSQQHTTVHEIVLQHRAHAVHVIDAVVACRCDKHTRNNNHTHVNAAPGRLQTTQGELRGKEHVLTCKEAGERPNPPPPPPMPCVLVRMECTKARKPWGWLMSRGLPAGTLRSRIALKMAMAG